MNSNQSLSYAEAKPSHLIFYPWSDAALKSVRHRFVRENLRAGGGDPIERLSVNKFSGFVEEVRFTKGSDKPSSGWNEDQSLEIKALSFAKENAPFFGWNADLLAERKGNRLLGEQEEEVVELSAARAVPYPGYEGFDDFHYRPRALIGFQRKRIRWIRNATPLPEIGPIELNPSIPEDSELMRSKMRGHPTFFLVSDMHSLGCLSQQGVTQDIDIKKPKLTVFAKERLWDELWVGLVYRFEVSAGREKRCFLFDAHTGKLLEST